MATLSDFITPPTADQIYERLIGFCRDRGLPTTSWGPLSWIPTVLRAFAEVLADAWFAVAQLANGGVLDLAVGRWLDRIAVNWYGDRRKDPIFTLGTFHLADGGGGPHPVLAGQCTVSAPGGLLYRNVAPFTVPAGGSVDPTFFAAAVGSAYNIPNNATLSLVTALPTVVVTNPPIGSTGTWITTLGADVESDPELRKRLSLKWALLSTGSPPAAYKAIALALAGVSRAAVDDKNPDGAGSLRVYIDAASLVATLQSKLDAFKPVGTKATGVASTTTAIPLPGTVKVLKAYRATAEAGIVANLTALQREIDIGGEVIKSEIIERIMSPAGVKDFEMGSAWTGTPNLQLGPSATPQFTLGLTYVEV